MSDAALFSGSCGATQASDPRDLSRSTTKGDSIVRPSPRAGIVTQQSFSMLEGEKMAPLRAEFGISRKTGYKINDRYKDGGAVAFSEISVPPAASRRSAEEIP
jgi:hypothetical protein